MARIDLEDVIDGGEGFLVGSCRHVHGGEIVPCARIVRLQRETGSVAVDRCLIVSESEEEIAESEEGVGIVWIKSEGPFIVTVGFFVLSELKIGASEDRVRMRIIVIVSYGAFEKFDRFRILPRTKAFVSHIDEDLSHESCMSVCTTKNRYIRREHRVLDTIVDTDFFGYIPGEM